MSQDDIKLSSAATMLKKAKSFRNDMRSKFIRPNGKTLNSNKPTAKSSSLVRAGSFNDGKKVDGETKKPELVRLDEESKKLLQALNYVKLICLRGLREQLAGSVTVVMEIVMDVSQLLSNAINQDSSVLASACSRLRQSLADLTRWSDVMLLDGSDGAIDLELADLHVNGMKAAVEELVSLASEKLKSRKRATTVQHTGSSVGTKASEKCSSIDLPLTSRERQLLEETSHLTATSGLSLSADNILDIGDDDDDDVDGDDSLNLRPTTAPPKPPLPHNIDFSKFKSLAADRSMSVLDDRPPALPVKKRNLSSDNSSVRSMTLHSGRGYVMSFRTAGHSPASSSIGSNPVSLASSMEDILDETDGHQKTPSVIMRQESRLSNYDNMTETCSDRSSGGTRQSVEDETDGCYPPLPDKKGPTVALRRSLHSLDNGLESYDNIALRMAGASLSCSTVMQHIASSELQSSQCVLKYSSRSASCQSNVTSLTSMLAAKAVHVTVADSGYISPEHIQSAVTANCRQNVMSSTVVNSTKAVHVRVAKSAYISSERSSVIEGSSVSQGLAPPLPPKLKHTVDLYMKMFGQCTTPTFNDIAERHALQSATLHNLYFADFDRPNVRHMHSQLFPPYSSAGLITGIMSPPTTTTSRPRLVHYVPEDADDDIPALPPKLSVSDSGLSSSGCRASVFSSSSQSSDTPFVTAQITEPISASTNNVADAALHLPASQDCKKDDKSSFDNNVLEIIDVADQLVFRKPSEDGPEVRGGFVEALVVHATAGGCGLMYQEAFLATYRMFMSPADLINKLLYRYNHFSKIADCQKKKIANNTFSLLVRVVDDLCTATDEHILQTLMELVYQLLSDDELMLARTMRKKVLEKYAQHRLRLQYNQQVTLLSSYQLSTKIQSILEFESKTVAEQMTLLDAELFQKIELPEVLLWTKEQSEEHSPNLTTFTEHFNKMSYWCRTRILEQEDARERERFFIKFIKIMKHLRRLNNFNSYLAILSAVDSAPVRRLEWQKQNIEVLKEYCQLIDSSAAFRAYRQVLAKTEPPCIPYIGLVLQDMTFVHIGNPDKLPDGQLNFTKCWQLYNIMDNMRRFKNCNYEFKKNSKVIGFFNNFDNYISEESLWQISEAIKPRGSAQKKHL